MELLDLEPRESVVFQRIPGNHASQKILKLTNTSSVGPVAFKVKTTAPKAYIIKPGSGTLPQGESADVQLILKAGVDEQQLSKIHRFLVQAISITSSEDVSKEQWAGFAKEAIKEQKLNVILEDLTEPSHKLSAVPTSTVAEQAAQLPSSMSENVRDGIGEDLLDLEPKDALTFNRTSDQPAPHSSLTLINKSSVGPVAFKVKTTATASKVYLVKPSSGILQKDDHVQVVVSLREAQELSTSHRFLVQAVSVPREQDASREQWKDFPKEAMQEKRLTVVFDETLESPCGQTQKESSSDFEVNASVRKHDAALSEQSASTSAGQNDSTGTSPDSHCTAAENPAGVVPQLQEEGSQSRQEPRMDEIGSRDMHATRPRCCFCWWRRDDGRGTARDPLLH